MKQCVRCGVHISDEYNKLWCKKCLERVNEELNGEVSRPFEYYFRFNLKRMKHENNELSKMLKRDSEEKQ